MSDFVQLVGAEDVRAASHQMRSAAEEMSRAALTISSSLESHERFLSDWLSRLEAILAKAQEKTP